MDYGNTGTPHPAAAARCPQPQDETLHPGAGTPIGGRAAIGRVEEKHGTGLSCSVYGALLGRHHVVVPSEICVYKSGMVYNTP